ncbi:MAG TPA: diaminopimelate epimerase [Candidatus Coproplasma stercoripullorum]|uniref:Diaminopimelate epimerase n=1 Tax=Candidatus Coproplasma stercoripullorum TaxID=2840751 RepID=A0A9D1AF72_9FIRM|nr:diaminopimelate epimerase [Candidatus Coproplasma stercoripullorum]
MLRKFYKMQGIGNDYIYFDCMKEPLNNPEELAVRLSDRHFGIGGDGIILLCPSDIADCRMRMFNLDGSEGKMCGNGIRCVGKLAHDLGYVKGDSVKIETLSGVKTLALNKGADGKVRSARVDMGAPVLRGEDIPSTYSGETVVNVPIEVDGKTFGATLVSMGNPHCVVFADPDTVGLEHFGPLFERHPAFPERINTEFVRVIDKNRLKMRVWERGSGETLACGTGACASAVAAVLNGCCQKNSEISVFLLGGELRITYTDSTVYMEGPAELVFTGEIEI